MNSGRVTVIAIVGITLLFGAGLWWTNTQAYYEPVELANLSVTTLEGEEIVLALDAADAIDADTSPLRFRACFTVSSDTAASLSARAVPYESPTPLLAPGWFDCFDAQAVDVALEAGEALAYLGTHEFHRGVDRVVAIFPDGRGFAWTQLNGTLE